MPLFLETYPTDEPAIVAQFGTGDIGMMAGPLNDMASMVLFDIEPGEVGRIPNIYPRGDQNIIDLRFSNVESINVVIDNLIWLRDHVFTKSEA